MHDSDMDENDPEEVYLQRLTALGESVDIVTDSDVYSATGMKLVSAGARINKRTFGQLIRHKLSASLDDRVSMSDIITAQTLVQVASDSLAKNPLLASAVSMLPETIKPQAMLQRVILTPLFSKKLTVMYHQQRACFDHCIEVAVFALVLGWHCNLNEEQLIAVVTAGVFHDLGELYLKIPDRQSDERLTPALERQIYSHPVIAYTFLKECAEYHPLISNAVLEHHERIDGSGYPNALRGDEISPLGRILAVAELVMSMIRSGKSDRVLPVIRTNLNKYDVHVTQKLHLIYHHIYPRAPTPEAPANKDRLLKDFRLGIKIMSNWRVLIGDPVEIALKTNHKPLKILANRIWEMRQSFIDAGIQPQNPGAILQEIGDDAALRADFEALMDETFYQLRTAIRELHRNSRLINQANTDKILTNVQRWVQQVEEDLQQRDA